MQRSGGIAAWRRSASICLGYCTSAGSSSCRATAWSCLRTRAVQTRAGTSTGLEVLQSSLWARWQIATSEWLGIPVLALAWAFLWWVVGRVATVASWVCCLCELLLEIRELAADWNNGIAMDVDETISTTLFNVLVDEAAGDDASHVRLVEAVRFGECSRVGNAAIFREANN